MSSLETQVREAIQTELSAWTLGVSITSWAIEAPEPGTTVDNPRAALWFQQIRLEAEQPSVINDEARGVWRLGEKEADFAAMFWLSSNEDYEQLLADFQREMVFKALAAGDGECLSQEIATTLYGESQAVLIHWDGTINLATPADTGQVDEWRFQVRGTVQYPWLEQEPADEATGLLDISVDVNDEYEYDLEDYEGD